MGGDIAKIAKKLYGKVWKQTYDELAVLWQDVNMYTKPELLKGKRLLFVVPPSSKLIDIKDIYIDVDLQRSAGNSLQMVERTKFDHIGTIIEETVVFPKRTLTYINMLEDKTTQ